MFWADKILENRKNKEWINDAWTPSGMIHMGGLKGPVIHDVLYKIVKEQKREVKYTFGFDDFDPIDGLPPELRELLGKYMGVPIFIAPSPDGNGSFGDYFGNKMLSLFKNLGVEAEIYYASDYYKKGIYNKAIKFALDHASEIRKVYEEMYKKKMAENWFPFQVICSSCGKLGTTRVTEWDGKEVAYLCDPNLVKWAQGCNHKGKMSPFDGNGKMPFKVEWAAKWWTFGVTIEGAGKDHASAGGTYDVAMKICKDVFKKEPPLRLPYEHFLSGGKKMASSKGVGLSAEDLIEVVPPQMARFIMIKTKPNQAVEFSPFGTDLFPKIYDDYQKAAESFLSKADEDLSRTFQLSQIDGIQKPPKVRFSTLAQWVQMPNMEKEIEKEGLTDWAKYAKVWLENYAPEKDKFMVLKELPEEVKNLNKQQKEFLSTLISRDLDFTDGEKLQVQLYDLTKELSIQSKDAFAAIYISLIGKTSGPKAAWLIQSLGKDFIQKRLSQASQ
ncbi:lysine--tRNA ligase [Patescibacteria group bacterium]|nr:lysine--tRNA ligase [Patescibacteria group bacterium]